MLKPLSAAALACVGLTLAGCSNPPVVIQSDPVIIEHEKTLDRVHNRDASVEFYGESRGGAAVRKNMAAHVLWNEHYEADAAALEAKRLAELENERLLEAERKAKAEAEVAKKKAQVARDSKDRSVYALKRWTGASMPGRSQSRPPRLQPRRLRSPQLPRLNIRDGRSCKIDWSIR